MRSGDKAALAELYERREPGLFRYALHMSGSRSVAEEVTHEVFYRLIGPGLRFKEGAGSLEAYLHGVARNLLREAARMKQREPELDTSRETAAAEDVLAGLMAEEAASALQRAVQELPEEYREAVVLCDLEEKSYDDAARLMACPVGTVRSRLHRARGLLAAKLRRLKNSPRAGSEVAR